MVNLMSKFIEKCQPDEKIQGYFTCKTEKSFLSSFLIADIAPFLEKHFVVFVGEKRVYFAKMSLLGDLEEINSYYFTDIQDFSYKKGPLKYILNYSFRNGEKIRLAVPYKKQGNNVSKNEDLFFYQSKLIKGSAI